MNIDRIDLHILKELTTNARLSMRELSKLVNLSAPSVAERVRNLEQFGIISGYSVTINCEKLGLPISCFVEATIKNGEYRRFKQFIATYPYALFCERIAGKACFITKLQLPNLKELENFIDEVTPFAHTVSHIGISQVEMKPGFIDYLLKEK
ncbi:Lrp/AsnC family transcriptional regulator [Priestia flexa]|uniref:Lrp/AsnC family transcriptional regulator n=1 Tax=Priestia flexa TaxID=86664 RepID=UPI0010FBFD4D|nr:Lrp/AsnC family transcriptional regulator [Priestia flexa]QCS52553.1 Lrp/AsnC family transcriptional regulator [Priestia flexa]